MNTVVVLVLVLAAVALGAAVVGARSLRRVPDLKVGVVYRRFGGVHPDDRFRVRVHGSAGPQARVLLPNQLYFRWPGLHHIRYVDMVHVPDGTVGLVEARAGDVRPAERRLCRHVECDYFQDGERFLANGGEQGRQPSILPGGAYYAINPELFAVHTVYTVGTGQLDHFTAEHLREVTVPVGYTGVVITLEGDPAAEDPNQLGPIVTGHHNFRLPWVFLAGGGRRGVQEETLDPGRYAINPWFARVLLVPTRDLILDWSDRSSKRGDSLDAALDQIVVDIEGYQLTLGMSQVLRIPARSAPRLVKRFGEGVDEQLAGQATPVASAPLQRFVERVLGGAVASYFTTVVSRYRAVDFLRSYNEIRLELEDYVRQALAEWDVVAGQTVLTEFASTDGSLEDLRRRMASAEIESQIERVRIDLEGERQVVQLRRQIELLGVDRVALERVAGLLASMPVPEYLGTVDSELLSRLPYSAARQLIEAALDRRSAGPADPDEGIAVEPPDEARTEQRDDHGPGGG
jgi:hypothetical protein